MLGSRRRSTDRRSSGDDGFRARRRWRLTVDNEHSSRAASISSESSGWAARMRSTSSWSTGCRAPRVPAKASTSSASTCTLTPGGWPPAHGRWCSRRSPTRPSGQPPCTCSRPRSGRQRTTPGRQPRAPRSPAKSLSTPTTEPAALPAMDAGRGRRSSSTAWQRSCPQAVYARGCAPSFVPPVADVADSDWFRDNRPCPWAVASAAAADIVPVRGQVRLRVECQPGKLSRSNHRASSVTTPSS